MNLPDPDPYQRLNLLIVFCDIFRNKQPWKSSLFAKVYRRGKKTSSLKHTSNPHSWRWTCPRSNIFAKVVWSRVIRRTAERQDHRDSRTRACHCRPTLLSTYHTSSPHHMNHSHHPPLPLQQKMLWGHAPLLCAHHSAWTEKEQTHSRQGRLKRSL